MLEEALDPRTMVQPDLARLLAAAIVALAEDQARCEQMGRAAVQRVTTDFDWERAVSAYLQVYDELLGLAPPSGQMDRT